MAASNALVLKLEHSGLLAGEDRRTLLALCAEPRAIPASTALVSQGEKTTGVHLILEGFAYRYKLLPCGQRQVIGLLLPGDLCDLQAALLRRSDHFIATLTDCSVVTLAQEAVDDLTLARTRIAQALWWSTLVEESILREWLANMGQRPADKWLAHFVCELLLRLQIVERAEAGSCEVPLTQGQIGDLLGISNVHVNRVLKELRGRNLLQLKNKRLLVPDAGRLRSFCDFDPAYLHLTAGVGPHKN